MKKRLINYIKAGFPCIAIETTEEQRIMREIMAAAKERKRSVATWSATEGLIQINGNVKGIDGTADLNEACKQRLEKCVYIFRDLQTWPIGQDPIMTRAFKDLLIWAPTKGSTVVVVGAEFKPHASFENKVTVLDYSLPSHEDLSKIADSIADAANKKIKADEDVVRAMGGLSTTEAENALALSLVETKTFSASVIYREKVQAVKRSGLLEIVDPDPRGLDAIGGLEVLKDWITKRKRAFSKEAEEYGLPSPRGVLLVGVPGTGKSLSAKAFGTALGVPTIRLDVSSLFNSLVGQSEARTRDALKLAEAMSPCNLWVDEIEKGLAGAGGSGDNDSGVTRRVFGTIVSWMQERRRPVFLVATANQIQSLPPELYRKGRFDEIFAIDLPSQIERNAILKIHLEKRKRDVAKFNLGGMIAATKDFTGSEIEAAIESAMFEGFSRQEEFTTNDVIDACRATTPLVQTAKEQIEYIRGWSKNRARLASRNEEQNPDSNVRVLEGIT